MSINAAGTDSGNGQSGGLLIEKFVISPDGNKVAFQTKASNLGPTDTNGFTDIYLRDLVSGTTTLVSANAAGTDSGNGSSGATGGNISFSADGNRIAFDSGATNLGPTDTNAFGDVYVRDLVNSTTTLVSANLGGDDSGNSQSTTPVFDPAGDRIAFTSFASDITADDSNSEADVLIKDLSTGLVELVSVNAAGTGGGNNGSGGPGDVARFSPDGQRVIFHSRASDLGPLDTNGTADSYVRDLETNTTSLLATNAAGTGNANSAVVGGQFSADGSKVLFRSAASDLGPVDTNGLGDFYVRDLASGSIALVSANSTNSDSGSGEPRAASFSPDGTKVVFASAASNLVVGDTNEATDIFVRELGTNSTSLVSLRADGTSGGNGGSNDGFFNDDGTKIVFVSFATDFGPVDTNGRSGHLCPGPERWHHFARLEPGGRRRQRKRAIGRARVRRDSCRVQQPRLRSCADGLERSFGHLRGHRWLRLLCARAI